MFGGTEDASVGATVEGHDFAFPVGEPLENDEEVHVAEKQTEE